ncbi:MAG: hypothetical protein ACOY3V_03120 [Pseudomonadota bacterium]
MLVRDSGSHIVTERIHSTKPLAYQVTAVFADGVASFSLSIGNTLADLAERLDFLGKRYSGVPAAVYSKIYKPFSVIPL